MRNIQIHLTSEETIQIAQSIGTWDKLFEAIGYLSQWSLSEFDTCRIYRDGNSHDLFAMYDSSATGRRYTIGAVWHQDHYGYHS